MHDDLDWLGELFMFAFPGTEYNAQLDRLIHVHHLANFIYFGRNVTSPDQVATLNARLMKESSRPLFIALDQEGGSVRRIAEGITPLPGAMALAACGDEVIEPLSAATGRGLKALGFNVDFAPDADVNTNRHNPVIASRSFGDDPGAVAQRVTRAVAGFQSAGIQTTLKHFPGHGNTAVDSHAGLPTISATREELMKNELVPFARAIAAGADGVMAGHLLVPALDPVYPATLSQAIITGLLREDLHFDGLVVTDSLTMGAIWGHYPVREIVKRGFLAGNDVLLFCGEATLAMQEEILDAARDLVLQGELPASRLKESLARVSRAKALYPALPPDLSALARPADLALARTVQEKSITLARDQDRLLPLAGRVLVLSEALGGATIAEGTRKTPLSLGHFLPHATEIILDNENMDAKMLARIRQEAASCDRIVVANYRASATSPLVSVWPLLDPRKTILVLLRSPYEDEAYPGNRNVVLAYEATPESLASLAHVLERACPPEGRLPIRKEE